MKSGISRKAPFQGSIDAVREAHATVSAAQLNKTEKFLEHMGQLVAYARMNGVVPPWSDK